MEDLIKVVDLKERLCERYKSFSVNTHEYRAKKIVDHSIRDLKNVLHIFYPCKKPKARHLQYSVDIHDHMWIIRMIYCQSKRFVDGEKISMARFIIDEITKHCPGFYCNKNSPDKPELYPEIELDIDDELGKKSHYNSSNTMERYITVCSERFEPRSTRYIRRLKAHWVWDIDVEEFILPMFKNKGLRIETW